MKTKTIAMWMLFVAVGVAACSRTVSRYEHAYEGTLDGEALSVVVARFGAPSVEESEDREFVRYASVGCTTPCAVRVWWEHPVLVGIEAWSVEFNSDNRVIQKAHWVSP